MIANFLRRRKAILYTFSLFTLIAGCKENKLKNVDVSAVNISLQLDRFEQELFAESSNDSLKLAVIAKHYPEFYQHYCKYIINAGLPNNPNTAKFIKEFYSNVDIKSLYADEQAQYADVSDIQEGIIDALKHYKYYFSQKPLPRVVTFISGFNYAIITGDSTLGIGLDMYMGRNYKHYPGIGYPMYKIARMQREYIVADCMRGLAQSEFVFDEFKAQNLLSYMVHNGKILYFIDAMVPNAPDSLKTGYTGAQTKWCKKNEADIWAHFIENKLLFSTEQQKFMKYIIDGPTTNGLPKESPSQLGSWIGWQIVKSYMDNNPNISLERLMQNTDAQSILNQSKYKP